MTAPRRTTMPEVCVRCGCGVVSVSEHQIADTEQRAAWKAQGIRRYSGRGLCATCFAWARNHGELDAYQVRRWGLVPKTLPTCDDLAPRPTKCQRCGVDQVGPVGLCDDCVLVVHDLHELEAWAS